MEFIQATVALTLAVILARIKLAPAEQSGLVFAIHFGFGIGLFFSSNSSMIVDHQTKFQVVNPHFLSTRVTID